MRLVYFVVLLSLVSAGLSRWHRADANGLIPNAQACIVPPSQPGEPAGLALQRVGPSAFAAQATWGAGQPPTITYAPAYFRLPPMMQVFLSLHECGHLVLHTTNEFRANCYAVGHGNWTAAELDLIGRSHQALGPFGPQYGGSGAAFWAATERTCPQYFSDLRGS